MFGPILTAMLDAMEPQAAAQIRKIMESGDRITDEMGAIVTMHSIAISLKRIADIMDWAQSAKLRNEI